MLRRLGRRSHVGMRTRHCRHGSSSGGGGSSSTKDKYSERLGKALQRVQQDMAERTVPWFRENMPDSYFRAINETEQLQHLNAITALQNAPNPELMLKSTDGKVFSFFRRSQNHPGLLANILGQIPNTVDGAGLARVKIFSALDGSLALDIFRFGKQESFTGTSTVEQEVERNLLSYLKEVQEGKYANDDNHPKAAEYFEPEAAKHFLRNCNALYVINSHPRRLASQIAMYHKVSGTESVAVDVEHGWEFKNKENKFNGGNAPQHMITIASANVLPKNALQKAASYLGVCGLTVLRAHMDIVNDDVNGHVILNRILVTPVEHDQNGDCHRQSLDWDKISRDLQYLKWLDDAPLRMAVNNPDIDVSKAEIIYTYANMLHGLLAKEDKFAYARNRLFKEIQNPQNLPVAVQIAELFQKRFDPSNPLSDTEFEPEYARIKAEIRENVENEDAIHMLEEMLYAVKMTLRTNLHVPDRYALALRMHPDLMGHGSVGTEIPYGVFFVHGRRFNGFHVRFRDISRGGLRVVAPPTVEQHAFESARQFNEAYSLAFAQQLKNKDIPEGGSKAVVLVEPMESSQFSNDREFVIRKSVKAFSDALLDLNTTNVDVKKQVVDLYGKDELIYLGPDENIIPSDIEWMTKRAAIREYPVPRAFISSKPDAGINHKVYGVTSEGVAVFADVALRSLGFLPDKEPFTVKITGGTDGDVAGNMIKILHREYGDHARVVGICDGTAVIENTDGLDMVELLRLVEEELPLSEYNSDKLGAKGIMHKADNPEGIRARNSMHNRVKADLFIPAGGRPSTINENNWTEYLDEDGKPSSKLIVEGANLFITPEARQWLFDEAGVIVVKDSSANKCGVICSSYEIIASMLVESETFMSIKSELVQDVLDKLRNLARVEAELMFREYKKDPSSALPPHSERISRAIIRMHDAILDSLENKSSIDEKQLLSLIEEHLPPTLRNVAMEHISNVPLPYLKCIIASSLASKIVYREGLQYAESLPASNLAQTAMKYLSAESYINELATEVENSGLTHAGDIADLLRRGGVRAGVDSV